MSEGTVPAHKPDRLTFRPHHRFVSMLSPEQREDYREKLANPMIQNGLTAAVAEMASAGFTREQLNGVIAFIDLFTNMSEHPKPPTALPVKSLHTL